jgi:hypothetical protein
MGIPLSKMFEAAARVGNEWSLGAFAFAAIVVLALLMVRNNLPRNIAITLGALAFAIVTVAAIPLVSRAYVQNQGIYRLRIVVEDPGGMPINGAKLTSSFGGEPKLVEGGWQFDIPVGNRPKNGKVTIYGRQESAFLSGKIDVDLSDDLNVVAKLRLDHDRTARILGRVVGGDGNPIPNVQISVLGYERESISTGPLGQFNLPAHASDGQQVQLSAFKKGVGSLSQWAPAGENPITLVLRNK